ncbi:hypothetical protein [Actinoplanes sp. HUAS TT8]|uniref:hypothetical protein n=1 Tax=Actinoplanes sp. HUAS TT8 TaxID=3447453 RepID=UPI003F51C543
MRIVAIALFALLAATGVTALGHEVDALAIPMILAGLGGATVALATRVNRGIRPAQGVAVVAALALVVTGVLLAPSGAERFFVITVDVIIAGLVVAFALLAPSRPA